MGKQQLLLLINFDFCVPAAEFAEIDPFPVNGEIVIVDRSDDVVQTIVSIGDARDNDGTVVGVGEFPRRLVRFRRHTGTEGIISCFRHTDDSLRRFKNVDDGGFVDGMEKFHFKPRAVRTVVTGVNFAGFRVPDDERVTVPGGNCEKNDRRKNKQGRSDNRCGRCLFVS